SFPEWDNNIEIEDEAAEVVKEMYDVLELTSKKNIIESWHDAVHLAVHERDADEQGQIRLQSVNVRTRDARGVDLLCFAVSAGFHIGVLQAQDTPAFPRSERHNAVDRACKRRHGGSRRGD
ncbi:MAG: hypothetical protein IIB89_10835, partial [Chloroflexi bacterium]|nr:hypothetical protein [Chloroflexota bacterium]